MPTLVVGWAKLDLSLWVNVKNYILRAHLLVLISVGTQDKVFFQTVSVHSALPTLLLISVGTQCKMFFEF